jgi:ferritin-like protein
MLLIRAQRVSNRAELMTALQNAIGLEHSTIPPYLTAYYTLNGVSDSVKYARGIIRDVVVEEMLHMTLVANILVAIGGAPKLSSPDFIPKYPGPLPLGIGDDDGAAPGAALEVGLKRYSKNTLSTVFMAIEEPENPIKIRDKSAIAAEATGATFQTIGQFYASVKSQIRAEGDVLFRDADQARQVLGWFGSDEEVKITDVASAERAIDIIVQQGEGTPEKPIDLQGDIPHFYRFQELFLGKKLVFDASSKLGVSFDPSQPITIDEQADVIQMVDNPGDVDLSREQLLVRRLSDEFDVVYSKLLNALQIAFNGNPGKMQDALGTMFELKTVADDLLQQRLNSGEFAGPRFRYVAA